LCQVLLSNDLQRHSFVLFDLNTYWQPLEFELPATPFGIWRRWFDKSLESPEDIVSWQDAPEIIGNQYPAANRSVVKRSRFEHAAVLRVPKSTPPGRALSAGLLSRVP
jgi:hypothetical protein